MRHRAALALVRRERGTFASDECERELPTGGNGNLCSIVYMPFKFVMISRGTLLRQLLRDKIESVLSARCLVDCDRLDDLPADLDEIDLALLDGDDEGHRSFAALHALSPARSIRFCCLLTSTRGSFFAHRLHQDEKLRGIVHSSDTIEETIHAIAAVACGATRISRHVDQTERRCFAALISPRETELTESFTYGATPEVVAARFGLSPATVRTHRRNLLHKLGAHNQTDLIRFALGSGVVPLHEFLNVPTRH